MSKTMCEILVMHHFNLFFLAFNLAENMKWAQMQHCSVQKWGTKWCINIELNSAVVNQALFRKKQRSFCLHKNTYDLAFNIQ